MQKEMLGPDPREPKQLNIPSSVLPAGVWERRIKKATRRRTKLDVDKA